MGNYKKERGVNPLNGYTVLFDTPRKERAVEGLGQKPSPCRRKMVGHPEGTFGVRFLWLSTSTELFQVSVLARHVNLTNLEGIRYDDRVE